MAASVVTSAAAAAISSWTCALSAFIFGLSSRTVATPSATSTRTNSPKPPTSYVTPTYLAEVAVGHAGGGVRVGDEAEFGAAGEQRVLGQHPDRVAERSGAAEFDRAGEPGQRRRRRVVGGQREVGRLDDLVVVAWLAVHDFDGHVVGGQPAECRGHPHVEHRAEVGLGAVGLDVLDPDVRPLPADALLPSGQVAGGAERADGE